MANEAFALSPMSARAAEPNEQDYDAIREAFMETARGRWFLGEYAKRNRNADTRMVLDAVAKIEEAVAAQRQPVVVDRLPEALVAIRRAVEETEAAAASASDPATIVSGLAPIQRGVRIIKEISWRWREIGADGRICDLIDSQLAAIEGACAQVSTHDPRAELKAAFDLLRDRIEQTDGGDAPQAATHPAPVQEAAPVAEAAPAAMPSETPVDFTEPQDIAAAEPAAVEVAEIAVAEEAMGIALAPESAAAHEDIAPEMAAFDETPAEHEMSAEPAAIAEIEAELSFDAAAEAEDDAVLERIALEMAAPDPEFDEILEPVEVVEPVEMAAADPEPMTAEIAAQPDVAPLVDEPVATAIAEPADAAPVAMDSLARLTDAIAEAAAEVDVIEQPAMAMAAAMPTPAAILPMPSPVAASVPEPSLGSTILASGMLQKPRAAANDPLAPIRRMTQAEKIAFFS